VLESPLPAAARRVQRGMGRVLGLLGVAVLLGACAADPDASSSPRAVGTPSASTSAQPTPPTYGVSSCPVADEAFCGTAVEVIEALRAQDADRLFELSREDRLVCAELNTEFFPGCATDDILEGHGLSGPNFVVEVVDEDAYRGKLDATVSAIDESFTDEQGDGDVAVVGVGTCGPDIPGRRTYHLAWTAAASEPGGQPKRLLGSFELTFQDDWRIALWYLGPLTEWEAEQADPMRLAFCEAGRSPWSA
jgi:hypothetical protein